MRKWVLGFCFSEPAVGGHDLVLLIRKTHPPYLAGKWNGLGGKVEARETAAQAMEREADEEAGLRGIDWRHFGTLATASHGREGRSGEVELFAGVGDIRSFKRKTEEVLAIFPTNLVMASERDTMFMPNLRWLVNLGIASLSGLDLCSFFSIREVQADRCATCHHPRSDHADMIHYPGKPAPCLLDGCLCLEYRRES